MSKNKKAKQEIHEHEEILDFIDMDDEFGDDMYCDDSMPEIMRVLMESSNHQMNIAIELTKLIVQNNLVKNPTEDSVFSIFKKASAVVYENHNLQSMMDQLGEK